MSQDASAARGLDEIEADWRLRLQVAETHYRHALDRHQQIMTELAQCLDNADNGRYEAARAKHDLAFQELLRCQEILVDLVLRKHAPLAHAKL